MDVKLTAKSTGDRQPLLALQETYRNASTALELNNSGPDFTLNDHIERSNDELSASRPQRKTLFGSLYIRRPATTSSTGACGWTLQTHTAQIPLHFNKGVPKGV